MDNAGDRKAIRAKEKQSKVDASQRDSVTRSIMSTTQGREWMWDLLTRCHCFNTTFNGDPLQSAFNEGQRSIGLSIIESILLACPDAYIQAMRESNERSTLTERRSSPQPDRGDHRHEGRADDEGDGDNFYVNDDDIYGDPAVH